MRLQNGADMAAGGHAEPCSVEMVGTLRELKPVPSGSGDVVQMVARSLLDELIASTITYPSTKSPNAIARSLPSTGAIELKLGSQVHIGTPNWGDQAVPSSSMLGNCARPLNCTHSSKVDAMQPPELCAGDWPGTECVTADNFQEPTLAGSAATEHDHTMPAYTWACGRVDFPSANTELVCSSELTSDAARL